MLFTNALLGASLAAFASATADLDFTSQGQFKVKNAAFVNVAQFEGEEPFLLTSSFGAFSSGFVSMVPYIGHAVKDGDVSNLQSIKLDTPKFEWPNNVEAVPQDVFGERAIVVPDGFLVPGKKNGGVYIIRMDATDLTRTVETVKISQEKKDYFYHMGFWVDLNGDGRKDFITARSNSKAG